MAEITELKRRLNERALEVAKDLFPRGALDGNDWCVGSIAGEPGKSLKICVRGHKVGHWADFAATGESGDLVDLWQATKRLSLVNALDDIRRWLGIAPPSFEKRQKTYRRPDRPKCIEPRSAVLDYLTRERNLSAEVLRAYRVGESSRTIVLPSCLPDGEIAFVKFLGVDRPASGKKNVREADPADRIVLAEL